jgi:hypothetical protein
MHIRDRIKGPQRVPASRIVGAPWNGRYHPANQVEALAGSGRVALGEPFVSAASLARER